MESQNTLHFHVSRGLPKLPEFEETGNVVNNSTRAAFKILNAQGMEVMSERQKRKTLRQTVTVRTDGASRNLHKMYGRREVWQAALGTSSAFLGKWS